MAESVGTPNEGTGLVADAVQVGTSSMDKSPGNNDGVTGGRVATDSGSPKSVVDVEAIPIERKSTWHGPVDASSTESKQKGHSIIRLVKTRSLTRLLSPKNDKIVVSPPRGQKPSAKLPSPRLTPKLPRVRSGSISDPAKRALEEAETYMAKHVKTKRNTAKSLALSEDSATDRPCTSSNATPPSPDRIHALNSIEVQSKVSGVDGSDTNDNGIELGGVTKDQTYEADTPPSANQNVSYPAVIRELSPLAEMEPMPSNLGENDVQEDSESTARSDARDVNTTKTECTPPNQPSNVFSTAVRQATSIKAEPTVNSIEVKETQQGVNSDAFPKTAFDDVESSPHNVIELNDDGTVISADRDLTLSAPNTDELPPTEATETTRLSPCDVIELNDDGTVISADKDSVLSASNCGVNHHCDATGTPKSIASESNTKPTLPSCTDAIRAAPKFSCTASRAGCDLTTLSNLADSFLEAAFVSCAPDFPPEASPVTVEGVVDVSKKPSLSVDNQPNKVASTDTSYADVLADYFSIEVESKQGESGPNIQTQVTIHDHVVPSHEAEASTCFTSQLKDEITVQATDRSMDQALDIISYQATKRASNDDSSLPKSRNHSAWNFLFRNASADMGGTTKQAADSQSNQPNLDHQKNPIRFLQRLPKSAKTIQKLKMYEIPKKEALPERQLFHGNETRDESHVPKEDLSSHHTSTMHHLLQESNKNEDDLPSERNELRAFENQVADTSEKNTDVLSPEFTDSAKVSAEVEAEASLEENDRSDADVVRADYSSPVNLDDSILETNCTPTPETLELSHVDEGVDFVIVEGLRRTRTGTPIKCGHVKNTVGVFETKSNDVKKAMETKPSLVKRAVSVFETKSEKNRSRSKDGGHLNLYSNVIADVEVPNTIESPVAIQAALPSSESGRFQVGLEQPLKTKEVLAGKRNQKASQRPEAGSPLSWFSDNEDEDAELEYLDHMTLGSISVTSNYGHQQVLDSSGVFGSCFPCGRLRKRTPSRRLNKYLENGEKRSKEVLDFEVEVFKDNAKPSILEHCLNGSRRASEAVSNVCSRVDDGFDRMNIMQLDSFEQDKDNTSFLGKFSMMVNSVVCNEYSPAMLRNVEP